VVAGDLLAVLEAMNMQHRIEAPAVGRIARHHLRGSPRRI
jgi:biotin carboxyl carrier protein